MKKLMTLAIAFIISVGAFAQNNEVWSSLKKDANFLSSGVFYGGGEAYPSILTNTIV